MRCRTCQNVTHCSNAPSRLSTGRQHGQDDSDVTPTLLHRVTMPRTCLAGCGDGHILSPLQHRLLTQSLLHRSIMPDLTRSIKMVSCAQHAAPTPCRRRH